MALTIEIPRCVTPVLQRSEHQWFTVVVEAERFLATRLCVQFVKKNTAGFNKWMACL